LENIADQTSQTCAKLKQPKISETKKIKVTF